MADRYWVGGTGNWADTSSWSATSGGSGGASVPSSSDNVYIDSNSGFGSGGTITITSQANMKSFSSSSGHTYTIGGDWIFSVNGGNVLFESGITFSNILWLQSSTDITVTFNGVATAGFSVKGTGRVTLQDDLETTGEFSQGSGTFDANDHNVTANSFSFYANTGYTPTTIMGSGTWEMTGEGKKFHIEQYSDEVVTFTPETSTIKLTGTDQELYFYDDTENETGKVFNNIWMAGTDSTTTVYGSNTFNDFKIDAGLSIIFEAESTTTVSDFVAEGTEGNLITINSSGGGAIDTHSLSNGGSDYSVDDWIWYEGETGSFIVIVTSVDGSGTITGYSFFMQGGTFTVGNYEMDTEGSGTGAVISVDSITEADTQHTLSKSSGTIECDYLDLSNSNATGGATWYANRSTDSGNNDGWDFIHLVDVASDEVSLTSSTTSTTGKALSQPSSDEISITSLNFSLIAGRVFSVNSDEVSLISPSVLAKAYVSAQVNSDEVVLTSLESSATGDGAGQPSSDEISITSLNPSLIAGRVFGVNSDEIVLTSPTVSLSVGAIFSVNSDEIVLTSPSVDFFVSKSLTALNLSFSSPAVSVDWDYLWVRGGGLESVGWNSSETSDNDWTKKNEKNTIWEKQ